MVSTALHDILDGFHRYTLVSPELERRRSLDALGPVDLEHRLTSQRIHCGDCGPSLMMRDGTCATCAGHGWAPAGRGWLFLFHEDEPTARLVPVGGSRLRAELPANADEPVPVETEPLPLRLAS